MARSSLRTSRMLIGLLAVTLGAGTFTFYKNYKNRPPMDAAHAPVTLVKAPGTAKPDDSLMLMAAVSPKPTTAPSLSAAPSTQPVAMNNAAKAGDDLKPVSNLDNKNAGPKATTTVPPTLVALAPSTGSSPTAANAPAQAVGGSGDVFADAKAKQDAEDLLGARKILNDALLAGKLSPDQIQQAKEQLSGLNDIIVLSPRKFVNDSYAESYTVKSGDRLAKIAAKHEITPELLLRMNGLTDARKLRADQALKIVNGPFNAVVTKSAFTLDLYIGPPGEPGSMFVKQYKVALGKDDSTPPGTWMCEAGKKQKNPKFWGSGPDHPPMEAGDPKNPLGQYWIGLVGTDGQAVDKHGYGIHGTIDPDSIGHQASLGCIRLKNEDVAVVYEMLLDGKSIVLVKP